MQNAAETKNFVMYILLIVQYILQIVQYILQIVQCILQIVETVGSSGSKGRMRSTRWEGEQFCESYQTNNYRKEVVCGGRMCVGKESEVACMTHTHSIYSCTCM